MGTVHSSTCRFGCYQCSSAAVCIHWLGQMSSTQTMALSKAAKTSSLGSACSTAFHLLLHPRDLFGGSLPSVQLRGKKPKHTVKPGHQCTQLDLVKGVLLGSEDCLYLSVYVPKECTPAAPCATMQWIYGGGWELGSNREFSLYDASSFAKKNGVVVVAGNYRLDTFGWLALAELQQESADGAYGNYGLKDQRAAMQWTQRNIGLFGGDPNKVTIFGESAGAWSVCQHLVAPASNGLFSAGIMESGDC